ncbi:Metallo-beta-lactamase family protein [Aspergillus niger]|uniref:Metallo-beta-lactamase family protein n=1 Tax=Aspergillus niger TaxID=5061 RepID=A0A505HZF1_ASPNG|nr:Metallo-beta-lactamase family protein [Aspergillus niger]
MNNDQFRRLVLDNPSSKPAKSTSPDASSPSQQQPRKSIGNATPAAGALGSRLRSSIPMTPRSITNVDFARQLAEYRREAQPASKKFKASAAPKGTRLPSGYQDRAALLRQKEAAEEGDSADDGSNLEKRVKALEEMVKLGQIDQATFEKLRAEMGVGGDLKSTHMVKGLDWELLRRVKGGEDELDRVLGEKGEGVDALSAAPKENKEKKKKGVMVQRKSRDEILRELKASRAAAAAEAAKPAEPALGTKFRRIGGESKAEKKRWVEQDENGRRKEILQITDAEGKTKRKVRWLDKPGEVGGGDGPAGLLMPDKDAKPLGMEIPAEVASKASAPAEHDDDDDDIFAGVGDDYNPLGDLPDDDDSSDESEDGEKPPKATEPAPAAGDPKKPEATTSRPRNYFSTSTTDEVPEIDRSNPLAKDPTLLAALKRAAALRQSEEAGATDADAGDVDDETALRRRKFLEEALIERDVDRMAAFICLKTNLSTAVTLLADDFHAYIFVLRVRR